MLLLVQCSVVVVCKFAYFFFQPTQILYNYSEDAVDEEISTNARESALTVPALWCLDFTVNRLNYLKPRISVKLLNFNQCSILFYQVFKLQL